MSKLFSSFKKLSLLMMLEISFLGITSPIVKAENYPLEARKEFMYGCMEQPLSIRVNPEKRQQYCICLFNFLQKNVPYEVYKEQNEIIKTDVRDLDPDFLNVFQQGTQQCFEMVFK